MWVELVLLTWKAKESAPAPPVRRSAPSAPKKFVAAQRIVAGPPTKVSLPRAAIERVGAIAARKRVVAVSAEDEVIAKTARDLVVVGAAKEEVVAVAAVHDVVAVAAVG